MTGIFVILLSQDGFERDCPQTEFQTITSKAQFEKVTVRKFIVELWTLISNQIIKYQLLHTRCDQISDYKHDIYLYGKISTELLAQAATRISRSEIYFKLGVLENFTTFTGKHLCWNLFWIKLQALTPATLLKRDFNTGVSLWTLQNI